METAPKTDSKVEPVAVRRVEFAGDVLQQIRQHARSSMRAEICGVLIGNVTDGVTRVTARIAGEGASQGGAHVTFTQDTWEHIYKVKDAQFTLQSIVGWYHSHPGFGIFLSDYDLFIHENFFNAQHQVAWVFDPHSDEEGCFGWAGSKIEPLAEVSVVRKHRAPDPEQAKKEAVSRASVPSRGSPAGAKKKFGGAQHSRRIIVTVLTAVLAFAGGFAFRSYCGALKPSVSPQSGSAQTPAVTPTPAPQPTLPFETVTPLFLEPPFISPQNLDTEQLKIRLPRPSESSPEGTPSVKAPQPATAGAAATPAPPPKLALPANPAEGPSTPDVEKAVNAKSTPPPIEPPKPQPQP